MKHMDFMDDKIEKLLARIKFVPGENVLIFVDTGAVIDAEKQFRKWRLFNSSANLEKIYTSLFEKGLKLYVTAPVFSEVLRHYFNHKINGRPEISAANFGIVEKLHRDYEAFLQGVQAYDRERDHVRRDTYWASISAFGDDEKKGSRDPISDIDKDLVSSAVLARYSHSPVHIKNAAGEVETVVKRPDRVIVLSPDEHIRKTINFLLMDKNYDGIGSVASR